jgi:hypothetical protein
MHALVERDQKAIGSVADGGKANEKVHPAAEEVRSRTLECPADRPQRTVWIEVARQVEADLSGESPTHP